MNLDIVSIFRTFIGPLLAAGAVAMVIYLLVSSIRVEGGASKKLREYRGEKSEDRQAMLGDRVANALPVSLDEWEMHLEWAQRGGYYPNQTMGNLIFTGLMYAGISLLVLLVRPIPIAFMLPVVAFIFPFFALRSKANKVRKLVVRGMPDMASLVAAEISAGTPADQAIVRATELPGPLSGLLTEAITFSRQSGRPLFSRKPVKGALVEVFSRTDLTALRAFALQVDEVANKGVDAPALMTDTARSLSREYRERVMMEKELLSGRLTQHVAFHFFMPAVIVILMGFFLPVLAIFSGTAK